MLRVQYLLRGMSYQIELINLLQGLEGFILHGHSGNRKRIMTDHHLTYIMKYKGVFGCKSYVQLEKGQIGIVVNKLFFALESNIFLEYASRLRVVAVEAVENGIDVLWPIRCVVKWYTHCCDECNSSDMGVEGETSCVVVEGFSESKLRRALSELSSKSPTSVASRDNIKRMELGGRATSILMIE